MKRFWFMKLTGLVLIAVLVAGLAAAACGDDVTPTSEEETATPTPTKAAASRAIRLHDQGADTPDLENFIAKKILEDEMGYEVEFIPISSHPGWPSLANGSIDVSTELWPNSHAEDIQKFMLDDQLMEFIKPLGATGTTEWLVPTYVIEGDAARGIDAVAPDLVSWEQLDQYKDVFASVETAPKGRILLIEPGWARNEDRVEGLGIDYEYVYGGSEAASIATVESAIQKGDPILFYWYEPHYLMGKYDFTSIELPPYSEECYATDFACDAADDVLQIGAWVGFKDEFPEPYQFFQNFTFTNDDLAGMLTEIESGTPLEEAAQKWMDANEATWRAWIP